MYNLAKTHSFSSVSVFVCGGVLTCVRARRK